MRTERSKKTMIAVQGRRISVFLAYACLAIAPSNANTPLDLNEFHGRVVYLDFWASWCAPCKQSFPWMNRMQREFGQDGFVVVAVNVDHVRPDAAQFLHEYSPGFKIVFDPDGAVAERFGVKGMPTSFLIDRDGHVHSEHEGFRLKDRGALEQQIRSLLAAQ